uniref:NADH-ubiquinone oxidoreductase chain 4L n=1 Tax=Amblyjoppa sp. ZJUH_2016002 TaxID=2491150 RepID=A0A3Q8U9T8_9HYME|nr:NADH dehydrogenase subunit 4L [Amblyjoppa sp. ZJUH_2016002]
MYLDYYVSLYLYMISCFMLSYFYKHLLLTVISLEFMMIFLVYNMFTILIIIQSSLYLMIMFLTVAVCEGALSLSLIVLLVRFYGNDYINSLVILKW